ncbi:MAG: hypothetical protein WA160_08690 [Pseudobdellovibrio sp.]
MKDNVNFSKLFILLTGLTLLLFSKPAYSQIISQFGSEVTFRYTATFKVPLNTAEKTDQDRAQMHAQHLFGIMHSAILVRRLSIDSTKLGGIGAPRSQMQIDIISSETLDNTIQITYSNSGKMLLHKTAAKQLLKAGFIELPLPANPYEIYDKNCTDQHYQTFGDYWYFYDIFKSGCTYLNKEPYAHRVQIEIKATKYRKLDLTPKLPYLRGNNGNGDLFSIYMIHGFAENLHVKDDDGRKNFNEFDQFMQEQNFLESRQSSGTTVPLHVFTKTITLENGKQLHVEVKHMLVDTAIESRSVAFANFFKDAVENADVIMYAGHSGLGGNIDIPSLELKAGKLNFNPKKKQIFFFESCSSYSYYLEHFAVEKTKAKIDVITNGLSSYFTTSNGVITALMKNLLSPKITDTPWIKILKDMESGLNGETYLLNVGGL